MHLEGFLKLGIQFSASSHYNPVVKFHLHGRLMKLNIKPVQEAKTTSILVRHLFTYVF